MSHPTFIFTQNRRRQTPITTIPPLQNRTRHDNILVQLHQNKHKLDVTDLWTALVELESLLGEASGPPGSQGSGCRLDEGIPSFGVPRSACGIPQPLLVTGGVGPTTTSSWEVVSV